MSSLNSSSASQFVILDLKGFEDTTHPEYVCKLHESIHGLKQALRAWILGLSQAILELGFLGSSMETSLFYFH